MSGAWRHGCLVQTPSYGSVPWTTGDGGPNRDSNPVTLQSFASRSRNALLGSFNRSRLAKVKSLSPHGRIVIVSRSPNRCRRNRTASPPSGESRQSSPTVWRRTLSPVRFVSENPQNCGDLLLFPGQSRQISLHFRLYGGEGGIRTPDTLSGMPVFKTGAINRSATSPEL
jgi:hypothetical protein